MTNSDASINRILRPHHPDAGPKGTGGYLGDNWEWCWDWHNEPDEYWTAAGLLPGYEYTFEPWTDLDYAEKHLATQMKVLGNHGPDGVLINGTASNVAANADSDVSPGARYVHRVKARNGTGLSHRSTYFDANLPEATAVTVFFEQTTYTVGEGESVEIAVILDTDPERTVDIPIVSTNPDDASDADHSGVPSEVTFESERPVRLSHLRPRTTTQTTTGRASNSALAPAFATGCRPEPSTRRR